MNKLGFYNVNLGLKDLFMISNNNIKIMNFGTKRVLMSLNDNKNSLTKIVSVDDIYG